MSRRRHAGRRRALLALAGAMAASAAGPARADPALVAMVINSRTALAEPQLVVGTALDPVAASLAQSLARPGGNNSLVVRLRTAFADLAARLGLEAQRVDIDPRPELPALRAAIDASRPDVLFVVATPVTVFLRHEIAALAATARLPVVAPYRSMAEAGALASYGADQNRILERVAWYVDRILQGASPADLPFEQPTAFELVVNLRAARALGIDVPPNILVQADEVIE
jgi:ABC-type uncharacterized transport system substrate-binding protein